MTLGLIFLCFHAGASPNFVTLWATDLSMTNEYSIPAGLTARVVAFHASDYSAVYGAKVDVLGAGVTNKFNEAEASDLSRKEREIVIAGPAAIRLYFQNSYIGGNAYLTLELLPEAVAPNLTTVVPPSTNGVSVTLECSTDLKVWTTTTNGIYAEPVSPKFFRVRLQAVP
jgi:hypothetical protein